MTVTAMPDSTPLLSATNIRKSFGTFTALHGVDLQVSRGEVVCIVGSSGSGKSTLLRCLNLLEIPDEGEVQLEGRPVGLVRHRNGTMRPPGQSELNRLRSRVGMVFQSFNLFRYMSVLDNLIEAPIHVLGMPRAEAVDRARQLLARVRLSDKIDEFPDFLSGGQKQRIAIARTLAMNPQAILLDEPTSALDPEMVKEVMDVLTGLAADGMTMICVTHEHKFAERLGNRIVTMGAGRITGSRSSA